MECQNRSDKYIWSPHDAYFYKGLSELIVDIDRLIYLSLEKIRKDFVFINLNTDSLSEFINRDNEWLSAVKGKQVVLIAARKSEALANYWYYNSNIRGVVYAGLSRDIRKELAYVINGRFLRKDIKKDKITDREMEIIRMTAQGMQPKSIARIENCSVKTVYTHRRNAEVKLYSKIYKLAQEEKAMKKKVLAIALVTVFTGMGVAQAADVTAQAVATWSATAKKDTTSKLVVTPLGSLAFQYAEGIKGFNSQKGLFDVAIEGDSTATAFKLTSRLITNTLTQLDTSGSTLNVGVDYNGAAVEKTGDTVMIDTANGVLGGNLSPLANGYNASNRTTAQDGFTFTIISGTTNGTTAVTDYSTLPEGIWSGDVSVQFDATWTS